MLDRIRIVLVNTSHPGNIGGAARAMKTMGLSQLFLVNPKLFPDMQATALAAGAEDILQHCHVMPSLMAALEGCHFIIATSARQRYLPWPAVDPRVAAKEVLKASVTGDVAIIFGSERTGLLNEELQLAHKHLVIPTSLDYASLNLAAAVQVICYELKMASRLNLKFRSQLMALEDLAATPEETEFFYQHLQRVLFAVQFLNDKHFRKLMQRLRRLFQRSKLTQVEVNILRGILTAIEKKLLFKPQSLSEGQ